MATRRQFFVLFALGYVQQIPFHDISLFELQNIFQANWLIQQMLLGKLEDKTYEGLMNMQIFYLT